VQKFEIINWTTIYLQNNISWKKQLIWIYVINQFCSSNGVFVGTDSATFDETVTAGMNRL
jgi:hypothetical protein